MKVTASSFTLNNEMVEVECVQELSLWYCLGMHAHMHYTSVHIQYKQLYYCLLNFPVPEMSPLSLFSGLDTSAGIYCQLKGS